MGRRADQPWDFTDIDPTISGGVSINGKKWGRHDDTLGIAGVVNAIAGVHQAFFNAGGLGVLIGDGQLPHGGPEQILEAYYSYAVSASIKLSLDYQFIINPGYKHRPWPGEGIRGPLPLDVLKVIASGAKQSRATSVAPGLLRRPSGASQ